jgi:D-alanine-D-alanine ligase
VVSNATVVFGGPSAEHDISILTGLQAERVLSGAGVSVQSIYWSRADDWFLVPNETEARDYLGGEPKGSKKVELRLGAAKGDGFYLKAGLGGDKLLDCGTILNCLHGGLGEGGGAQALFRLAGIPATGGTLAAAALGMDKLAFSALMWSAGLPVLPRELLSAHSKPTFEGPYIIKPRFGGSSIGIYVTDDHETAATLLTTSAHLREGAVVEPNRPDLFDLNVSVRTGPEVVISEIERPIRPQDGQIYDYTAKYISSQGLASAPREFPAQISEELRKHIRSLAARTVELTGLTGILRIDFLSDGADVFVNEVNSIPGAMALYLWPDTAPATVLSAALDEAEKHAPQVTRNFEEGAALRAAGGIASKLASLPGTTPER